MKRWYVLLLVVFTSLNQVGCSQQANRTSVQLERLKAQLTSARQQFSTERVYVMTDRPLYNPGDTIWYAGFVREGESLKPATASGVLHTELLDPKGSIVASQLLLLKEGGHASGDFVLSAGAAGGMYTLKAWTKFQENDSATLRFEKTITVQRVTLPRLKMKLDFERKAHGPGDEVIAKLDLQTLENQALENQAFTYVVSIAGKEIMRQAGQTGKTNPSIIRFNLPADLSSADGLLNVLIPFQGQTEAISRSIPIVLNKIKVQFFAEGGDLVAGLMSRVAFQAVNEFGKPADIGGVLVDDTGREIAKISSYHQGMGDFMLKPEPGRKYALKITQPFVVAEPIALPNALPQGVVLRTEFSPEQGVQVYLASSRRDSFHILLQMRGVAYGGHATVVAGGNDVPALAATFEAKDLPAGVGVVTVFDNQQVPRAERLVFINRHKKLKIEIKPNKEQYLPREEVILAVRTYDENNRPVPATVALSVTDDKVIAFADDKQGQILSKMLLEPELQGKVEEPNFYFDEKEAKSVVALDLLLRTRGWRRWVWGQLKKGQSLPNPVIAAEKGSFTIKVLSAESKQGIVGVSVRDKFSGKEWGSDKNGIVEIPYSDRAEGMELVFEASGYNPQSRNYTGLQNREQMVYLYKRVNHYSYGHMKKKSAKGDMDADIAPRRPAGGGGGEGVIEPLMAEEMKRQEMPMRRARDLKEEIANVEMDAIAPPVPKAVQPLPVSPTAPVAQPNQAQKPLLELAGKVADERWDGENAAVAKGKTGVGRLQQHQPVQGVGFYRTREFYVPAYDKMPVPEVRTDFRETVYWNGNLTINQSGQAIVKFFNSDAVSSFRCVAEGLGNSGLVGRGEKLFYTQLPLGMEIKVPAEVVSGDKLLLPVTLRNNTQAGVKGSLQVKAPAGWKVSPMGITGELNPAVPIMITLAANETKTCYLPYQVSAEKAVDELEVMLEANGLRDAFRQQIRARKQGFPVRVAVGGNELKSKYAVVMSPPLPNTHEIDLRIFPDLTDELLDGVDRIIREPYGCFEQASSANYPNVLALRYLQEMNKADPVIAGRASEMMDRGYQKLVGYETKEKGFEWFGASPPHEALTAYGLMEFYDMKPVYAKLDNTLIQRTADLLLERKDGKGGFKRNTRALDTFGRASEEVTNAYIVYALTETGYGDKVGAELEKSYQAAMASKDPYVLALVANAAYNTGQKQKGDAALAACWQAQSGEGGILNAKQSITCSGGEALHIETTSLAVLAALKAQPIPAAQIQAAVKYLVAKRGVGSTQSTILMLKTLTAFAKVNKRVAENGRVKLVCNGEVLGSAAFKAGQQGEIRVPVAVDKAPRRAGSHEFEVNFEDCKQALPHALTLSWQVATPPNDPKCAVELTTNADSKRVRVGETVRLNVMLRNKTANGLPMTMAIVGIPAGLSAQPWQLKELQEKGVYDFYEIWGSELAIYYRQMKPNEVREINLDLKAEIPGKFEATASRAYLYYTNEYKHWQAGFEIEVMP